MPRHPSVSGHREAAVLAAERRQLITELIRKQKVVRLRDLCDRLEASESTIRRDLEYLEQQGVLERTYGGATVRGPGPGESTPFASPALTNEVKHIGAAAAGLIAEGETVFLGPGAAVMAAAQALAERTGVTVVTNALNVASYLAAHSRLVVVVTGGQVEREETALLGHLAELALDQLRADRALIGVGGIQVPDGLTADRLPGSELLRAVIDTVPQVTVVAPSSKWGHVGPAFLAPLEAVDTIVTGRDAPPAMVWDLTELGIRIIQS
jgi:DeoR/GlpR family transcriptional regulator of sugar metabolism